MTTPPFDTPAEPPDIWYRILSHSVAAPSPLNTQPWSVLIRGPQSLDLFLDTNRFIPRIDPTLRQAIISSGAFIENLDIAAREAGYRAEISLFPSGLPGGSLHPDHPVARIELSCDETLVPDPLFPFLTARYTNRRIYTAQEILAETFSALACSFDQQFTSFGFSAEPPFRKELAGYLREATEIELSDPDRTAELLSYIRLHHKTGKGRQDGYGSGELGLSGVTGWLSRIRLRMCPAGSKTRCARALLIRLTQKQADSAAAFGWIVTKGNFRHDQVRAGRAYQRVHLTAASLGLSLHSMTPILELYPGMEEPGQKFRDLIGIPDTHTVQMLFRLGYSVPGSPSKRRPVEDLLQAPREFNKGSGAYPPAATS